MRETHADFVRPAVERGVVRSSRWATLSVAKEVRTERVESSMSEGLERSW